MIGLRRTMGRPVRWIAARSPLQLGVAWFVIMAVAGYGLLHKSEILLRLHDGKLVRAEFASRYKLAGTISKVELGGVRVGTITGLKSAGDGGAVVTMKLDRSVVGVLGTSPRAAIRPATLLGGPGLSAAVELTSGGTAGRFDGDRIPRDRTSVPVELDRVLEVLSDQARAGISTGAKGLAAAIGADASGVSGQQQLGSLLANAPPALGPAGPVLGALNGAVTAGTPRTPAGGDLHRLVDELGQVSAALTAHDGELEGIVDGSASVAGTFGDRAKDAAATVAGMPGALDQAQKGLAALGSSLDKLQATSPGARPSVQRLTELLGRLTPVLAKGRPVLADLRPLAAEARPVVEQLTPTAVLARQFLADLDQPVIGRLAGPVASTVLSPYRDSTAKLYEELGYLTTGLAGMLQYTEPNGAMLNFYAGFDGTSLSSPVNGPRRPAVGRPGGRARKALG
ncbi:MAG: phospholipid/cholesterol/gamma-HCH transport system substrate-binding protein [Actinomycetota bacterium]|nr:phospholipid/cholesterol/gamma-HCH transport system substrate-binding protein [Actinomycetota bacterium]